MTDRDSAFILAPEAGWPSPENGAIYDLICSTLSTERRENPWRYYGLTSDTSIWDSDEIEAHTYLSIAYEKSGSEIINEMVFSITKNESPYSKELSVLKDQLIRDFNLVTKPKA